MKYLSCGFVLAAVFVLAGCTVSLQPFYSQDVIVDDPTVTGRWTDGETTWDVTRTAPGHYTIATCEDGQPCKPDTVGVLFKTAGVTFLDFQEKSEGMFSTAIHPHGLFKVHSRGDELELSLFDNNRLAVLAGQHRLDTDYAELDSAVLLTGNPRKLQKFVVEQLSDPRAFAETTRLQRPD